MYDLIGDIHGQASPLRQLPRELGYAQRGGVFRHPERQVIFLDDLAARPPLPVAETPEEYLQSVLDGR